MIEKFILFMTILFLIIVVQWMQCFIKQYIDDLF